MNKVWATKKGFTIIELLVAIVVIGILATIMIISYSGIQQQSRDSERGSDIVQLKMAIEKYHAETGSYPSACADNAGCAIGLLATGLGPYLATIPHDPKYASDSANDYKYVRSAVAYDAYAILIQYEAKAPCKTGQNVVAGWWGVSVPTC